MATSSSYWKSTKSIYPLITFRIIFGILMMVSVARFVSLGWVEDHYIDPIFHFKYYGFSWVKPLGIHGMYGIHILLFLSALAVTLGYRYRIASLVLFATFTYTELIDLTYYLNHYYFVSLILLIMVLLPMHRAVSLDIKANRVSFANRVPSYMLHSLMLMISIVYIYAGLAKVNQTWLLEALPLRIWLPAHDDLPILGSLFRSSYLHYLFAWVGMFYDTFIILFLILPKTRKLAFFSVVIFHSMTGLLFQIGVFPIVMICVVTIFFSADCHQNILKRLSYIVDNSHLTQLNSTAAVAVNYNIIGRQLHIAFFVLFFMFQLLFPLRHFLYSGNIFWTEQGYRFSWRVMLMEKSGTATFYIKAGPQGREGQIFNSEFLNDHQEKQMAMQPDMILQYAHYLGKYYEQKGIANPVVTVEAYVTLNGTLSRLLVDPEVDLMKVEETWSNKDWLIPYHNKNVSSSKVNNN